MKKLLKRDLKLRKGIIKDIQESFKHLDEVFKVLESLYPYFPDESGRLAEAERKLDSIYKYMSLLKFSLEDFEII